VSSFNPVYAVDTFVISMIPIHFTVEVVETASTSKLKNALLPIWNATGVTVQVSTPGRCSCITFSNCAWSVGTPLVSTVITASFVKAKVFGQEITNNIYVFASQFDAVITVDTNGVPTLQAQFENVIHEHLPGVETWTVTPVAFQIGSNAFFSFDVEAVSTTSTVKWIGIIDITRVSTD
jgi:hypothetical protein